MIEFTIPRSLVMTSNHRLHWAVKARLTGDLRRIAGWYGRLPTAEKPSTLPVRAVVTFGYPDRRRRDHANLAPTVKPIIDGLVDAGILPDDSTRYPSGADPRIAYDDTVAAGNVSVTITFDHAM